MSDAVVTPETPAVTLDASAPKQTPPDEKQDPGWLNARLERERTKVLKDLGIDSVDDAKKALADLKAKQESEKSAAQKAAELEASFKAQSAKAKELEDALGSFAKLSMSGLTEAQRNAVTAIAGEDAALQLKTIEALKSTWASAAAPAAPAVKEVPKDTAPAPSMPRDQSGGAPTPLAPKEVWVELNKTNPILAARYALQHGVFDELFK